MVHSDNGKIPLGIDMLCLAKWEVNMAKMLADAGFATDMFGKGSFLTDPGYVARASCIIPY